MGIINNFEEWLFKMNNKITLLTAKINAKTAYSGLESSASGGEKTDGKEIHEE